MSQQTETTEKKSKYNEADVLKSLSKKRDVRIERRNIFVLSKRAKNKAHDLGNGSWGKIDYLTKNKGFFLYYVTKFQN